MNWIIAGGLIAGIYLLLFAILKAGGMADEQSQRFLDQLKQKKRNEPKSDHVAFPLRWSK